MSGRGSGATRSTWAAIFLASFMGAMAVSTPLAAQDAAAALEPAAVLQAQGRLVGEDGDTADDISGIACAQAQDGRRRCVIVNDENQSVQLATIEGDVLTADPQDFVLTHDAVPSDVIGSPPDTDSCSGGKKKFKELDLEAAAFDGTDYFVVGSHGCGRNNKAFRLSSFLAFKFGMRDDGTLGPAKASYRVGEILAGLVQFEPVFAHDLGAEPSGLNIEGLAIVDQRAYFGLRAPTEGATAYVVSTPVAMLFDAAVKLDSSAIRVHSLELAQNTGIRDMTVLPDRSILILAGPTLEQQEVAFSLHLWPTPDDPSTVRIASLADVADDDDKRAKAEAVAVMASEGRTQQVVVLFDGPDNGGPRRYKITLPGS